MDIKKVDKNMEDNTKVLSDNTAYIDLKGEYLRGLAFKNGFCRLDKGDFVSEQVQWLQKHPSGVNVTFKTNSRFIKIKALLDGISYMAHMTAVGQIGFDLYVRVNNKWVFLNTTKINQASYDLVLIDNLDNNIKEFRLYFPLYMGVNEAYLGIDNQASFTFIKEKQDRVVIYGTSISQGGCATRPGMSYTNILDRMLNYEFINLAFSGSARLESEMIDILNRIDCKYLILEVEANNNKDSMVNILPNFISKLRAKNIILISHFPWGKSLIDKDLKLQLDFLRDFQSKIPNVTFIDGVSLLEDLGCDETVDGVHLTDLGFYMLAVNIKPYLV